MAGRASSSREPISELAFADLIACVDGLTARKKALAERISRARDRPGSGGRPSPAACVPRVDTLTALAIHLELGADWHRFEKRARVGSWLGLTPSRQQSGESDRQGRSPRPARCSPAGCWSSPPGNTPANPGSV